MRIYLASSLIGLSVLAAQFAFSRPGWIANIIGFVIPKTYREKIVADLQICGMGRLLAIFNINDWVDIILWQFALSALVGLLLMKVRSIAEIEWTFIIIAMAITFCLPYIILQKACYAKQKRMANEIPAVLEVLAVVMEAGLAFDAAVGYLTKNRRGVVSEAFSMALCAIEAGMPREKAYTEIAGCGSVELRTAVRSILLAEKQGRPLKKSIAEMATSYRSDQTNMLEESANRLPATMLLPIFVFIVPPVLMIYLLPAIVSFMNVN